MVSSLLFAQNLPFGVLNCDRPPQNRNLCDSLNARGGLSGLNEFCENQEVTFVNDTQQAVDSTIYCWGDGSYTIESGKNNGKHKYNFPRDTCLKDNNGIIELEIKMIVFKRCANGYSVNRIATPILIRLRPKIDIQVPNPVCENTDFSIRNLSCGNDIVSNITCSYVFGNGVTSNSCGASLTAKYPQAGTYTFQYTMSNRCGEKSVSQSINVIGLPKAKAEYPNGTGTQPYLICLSGGGSVQVTGRNSTNTSIHRWTVSPSGNVSFSPRADTVTPIITFNSAGNYTIILRADNECQKPSFDTLRFKVVAAPALTLTQPSDGCVPFQYKPNLVTGATYERLFNGVSQGSFDPAVGFLADFGTHTIVAKLNNECGNQEKNISFKIEASVPVSFVFPANDTTVCLNSGAILLMVTPKGGTVTGSNLVTVRGDSIFFTPSVSGAYTLTYRRGSPSACEQTAVRKITVSAASSLTLNAQTDRCQPFLFKPSPIVTGAIYKMDTTVFDPNVGIQADTGTHIVTATLTNLCSNTTKTITFRITGVSAMQVYTHDTTVCRQGTTVRLSATAGVTWSGTGVNGNIFNPILAGLGTHTLTASTGQGECANSQSIKITVRGVANLDAGTDILLCNNRQTVPIPLNQGVPSGGVYRLGNPLTGQVVTQIDPSVLPLGTTKVFYVVTDSVCVNFDSLKATINGIPTASMTIPSAACVGLPVTFLVSDSTASTTYRWLVNDTLVGSAARLNYAFRTEGALSVALIIGNSAGCNDTIKRSIVVKRAPQLNVLVKNGVCHNQFSTVTNDTRSHDSTTTYSWTFRGQTYQRPQLDSIKVTNTGCEDSIYKLRLTATTGVCTNVFTEKDITTYPKLTAQIGVQGPDTMCSNQLVRFVNNSCGRRTRQVWTIEGKNYEGNLPPDVRFNNTSDTLRLIPIRLAIEGDCGRDTVGYRVWAYPLSIRARFNFNQRVGCAPFTVSFKSLTPFAAGFLYDFGDGTTSSNPDMVKTFDSVGVYKIRFRVFHPCGGFEDMIDSITVLASPKTNGLTATKRDRCVENIIQIKPNITAGILGRTWVDAINLVDSSRNPILSFPKAGLYTVKFLAINTTSGCTKIDSGQVNILSTLQLSATDFWDSCGTKTGAVALNATGGANGYRFAKNDTSSTQTSLIFSNLTGQRNYTFFVRDSSGCWASLSTFIRGWSPFTIDAGGNDSIFLGDSISRRIVSNYKPIQYDWQPVSAGIRSPKSVETVIVPMTTTLFTVFATDSIGCKASDSFKITVFAKRDVGLPNVFSPNGDKFNDTFFPSTSNDVKQINFLRVFDRLGNLIFENKNFPPNSSESGWDGTFKGQFLLPQTFAYIVEVLFIDNEVKLYKGDITIVR